MPTKLMKFTDEQYEVLIAAAINAGYAKRAKERVYGVEPYIHFILSQVVLDYDESAPHRKPTLEQD